MHTSLLRRQRVHGKITNALGVLSARLCGRVDIKNGILGRLGEKPLEEQARWLPNIR